MSVSVVEMRPYRYCDVAFQTADVSGQVYNLLSLPNRDMTYVIHSIIIGSAATEDEDPGALIELYEASSAASGTVDRMLLCVEVGGQETIIMNDANIILNKDKFINCKSTGEDAYFNIYYYDSDL